MSASSGSPATLADSVSSAPRVVVAEDEALIRLDLCEMLTEEGFKVVGQAAEEKSRLRVQGAPAAYLTIRGGLGACERLREALRRGVPPSELELRGRVRDRRDLGQHVARQQPHGDPVRLLQNDHIIDGQTQ